MSSENYLQIICRYWLELRQHLLYWLIFFSVIAIIIFPFANTLFQFFSAPLINILPAQNRLIAIGITSGFWIPIEFSLFLALSISLPALFYQIWRFIKPALKTSERQYCQRFLWPSIALFYFGLAVAYWGILPLILRFLLHAGPSNVLILPDIVNYFSFALKLLIAFGIICQTPLLVNLIIATNLLSHQQLKEARPYVIIIAFVIGLIIAPDIISQTLLAAPICLLYEIGLLISSKKLSPSNL